MPRGIRALNHYFLIDVNASLRPSFLISYKKTLEKLLFNQEKKLMHFYGTNI